MVLFMGLLFTFTRPTGTTEQQDEGNGHPESLEIPLEVSLSNTHSDEDKNEKKTFLVLNH